MARVNVKLVKQQQHELLIEGLEHIRKFGKKNKLLLPTVHQRASLSTAYNCGEFSYYENRIYIVLDKCARPGSGGRQWSSPGSKIDRTPYGVLCHEMGHAVEFQTLLGKNRRKYDHELSSLVFSNKGERITGYEPNRHEAFAESMRLFITNSDLLKQACPERYYFIIDHVGMEPVVDAPWMKVLRENGTHPAIVASIVNWVSKQQRRIK